MNDSPEQDLVPRSFRSWKQTELQKVFGLQRLRTMPELENWISAKELVPEEFKFFLKHLQQDLELRADAWTEEEWKLSFIGPVISMVDYNTETTSFFSGRTLEAEVAGYLLTGMPDGIVAEGLLAPQAPFFCLHEYKKEEGDQADPRGQLIAAMLACQAHNEDDSVIYGAYVLGRNWFFCTLKGTDYAFSQDYSSTKDDLFDIVGILLALKSMIAR